MDAPKWMVAGGGNSVIIHVRVQPRASKNELLTGSGEEERLRVRITAAPVNNQANTAVVRLLSKAWGLKRSTVSIQSGLHSRNKTLCLDGIDLEQLMSKVGSPRGRN